MPIKITFTQARANLANLCNKVAVDKRTVVITRRGHADVALIAAAELSGLKEALHLLRSPKNAERLLRALNRANARKISTHLLNE